MYIVFYDEKAHNALSPLRDESPPEGLFSLLLIRNIPRRVCLNVAYSVLSFITFFFIDFFFFFRWFCHVDDDNYVNVPALDELLKMYNPIGDWYLGRTSTPKPLRIQVCFILYVLMCSTYYISARVMSVNFLIYRKWKTPIKLFAACTNIIFLFFFLKPS